MNKIDPSDITSSISVGNNKETSAVGMKEENTTSSASLVNACARKCLALIEDIGEWQKISFLFAFKDIEEIQNLYSWLKSKGVDPRIKKPDGTNIFSPEDVIGHDTFLFSRDAMKLIVDRFKKWGFIIQERENAIYVMQ